VPGVGDPEDAGDAGLAVGHQPVHPPQHLAHVGQVVLGRQPGAGKHLVVVGAALAVDQHELHGGAGGELAQEVGDKHGLAEPGQPGDHDAGDLGQADQDRAGVLGPPQPPRGQRCRRPPGQVGSGRREQRIADQASELDQPGSLLGGADGHAAPGVGQGASGALVVGQTGAGNGGHRGGHALVVDGELRGGVAVLAGPLVGVAQSERLAQQRPLGRQSPTVLGALAGGGPLGMPAIPAGADQPAQQPPDQHGRTEGDGGEQPQPDQQPGQRGYRQRGGHHRAHQGRRRRAISSATHGQPIEAGARKKFLYHFKAGTAGGRLRRPRPAATAGSPAVSLTSSRRRKEGS
jgi:hypothetical protein